MGKSGIIRPGRETGRGGYRRDLRPRLPTLGALLTAGREETRRHANRGAACPWSLTQAGFTVASGGPLAIRRPRLFRGPVTGLLLVPGQLCLGVPAAVPDGRGLRGGGVAVLAFPSVVIHPGPQQVLVAVEALFFIHG